jgi:p-cumate 2,3-dioxygenase beta subunit
MTASTLALPVGPVSDPALLSRIEQFLYREAALLDAWQLDEWLELMLPDVRYRVPAPGTEDRDPDLTLQVIHDDHQLLAGRVTRLKSKHAHAESPKSHTRRLVTNVRAEYRGDDEFVAHSNFHVLRNRLGKLDHFIGRYRHLLVDQPGEDGHPVFRIRDRLTVLDHELVEAGGTVSIVL